MFDFGNEFWAAIIGALVGVLGGGIISFGLQFWSFCRESKMAKFQRFQKNKVLAYSLYLKASKMSSAVGQFDRHFKDCYDYLKSHGTDYMRENPYSYFTPFGNLPNHKELLIAELALNEITIDEELLADTIRLEAGHNSIVDLMKNYRLERQRILETQKIPDVFDGDLGLVDITEEEFKKQLGPIIRANQMALELDEQISILTEHSVSVVVRLRKVFVDASYLPEDTILGSSAENNE